LTRRLRSLARLVESKQECGDLVEDALALGQRTNNDRIGSFVGSDGIDILVEQLLDEAPRLDRPRVL
jgi:hypothetical protein